MLKRCIIAGLTLVVSLTLAGVVGCGSDAGNTALLGTAIGAGVGALAGGDTEGALIGAAVGGGAGYMIGNESDKRKQKQEIASVRTEQSNETVWITNSNGSKTSVTLRRSGPNYIGPRGEVYGRMPTEEELRMVYGF